MNREIEDLERFASRVTDDTVRGLMLRMVRNGRAAERRGDQEGVARFGAAYRVYQAEARRRGIIPQDGAL